MNYAQSIQGKSEYRPEGFKPIYERDLEIDRRGLFKIFGTYRNLSYSLFKSHCLGYNLRIEHEVVGVAQKGNSF
jgi:hypothetical protein